ncbi:MAG: SIS domain-containing protein [Ferrimicrobium sp.]
MRLRTDTQEIWKATLDLPEQMERALSGVDAVCDLPSRNHIEQVVVVGMGGSGIAGDVAVATAAPFMAVPVTVVKGYDLPSYVGAQSLVIAVSFSGETEETLEALQSAFDHGARCIGVARGGEVERLMKEHGGCFIGVEPTIPQPRVAFGALSVSVLGALDRVGLFAGATQWVRLAIEQLKRRREELMKPDSSVERLAGSLEGALPLIVSAGPIGQVAAMRWKEQINENAKSPAFYSVYPEACHNELAGFEQNLDLLREQLVMVILRHGNEHPQIARRYDFATQFLGPRLRGVEIVEGRGEGELATLFDLSFTGDLVSLHLADQLGVDPGPIPVLTAMKDSLAG